MRRDVSESVIRGQENIADHAALIRRMGVGVGRAPLAHLSGILSEFDQLRSVQSCLDKRHQLVGFVLVVGLEFIAEITNKSHGLFRPVLVDVGRSHADGQLVEAREEGDPTLPCLVEVIEVHVPTVQLTEQGPQDLLTSGEQARCFVDQEFEITAPLAK